MRTGIYAIFDKVANCVAGQKPAGLHLFPHDAVAVRFFGDVFTNIPEMKTHVDDYELVQLGSLAADDDVVDDVEQLVASYRVVLTGTAWRIMNGPKIGEAHAS